MAERKSIEHTTYYTEVLQTEGLTAPPSGEVPRKLDQEPRQHGPPLKLVLLFLGSIVLSAASVVLFYMIPIKMPFGRHGGTDHGDSTSPGKVDVNDDTKFLADWTDGDFTFPGMDDNVTCLEACSQRIISELYQARHMPPDQQPFSTFLHQDDWNKPYTMESTEPYPGSCPRRYHGSCTTFPEYMQTCNTTKYHMNGFRFYTDASRELEAMIWQNSKCDIDGHVIKTIPLIDGTWTGYVQGDEDASSDVAYTISVPDISNSCWTLECKRRGDSCVESVKKNLRRVSLNDFVMTVKDVMCE